MAIDISTEKLVSLREATAFFPRRRKGKKPDVSCVYRWTMTGLRGVILESVNVGTRCTSREAIVRFIERLTELDSCPHVPNVRSSSKDDQHSTRAELKKYGLYP